MCPSRQWSRGKPAKPPALFFDPPVNLVDAVGAACDDAPLLRHAGLDLLGAMRAGARMTRKETCRHRCEQRTTN